MSSLILKIVLMDEILKGDENSGGYSLSFKARIKNVNLQSCHQTTGKLGIPKIGISQ